MFALREALVAQFHQAGGFQPPLWKSAADRHESAGEIESLRTYAGCSGKYRVVDVNRRLHSQPGSARGGDVIPRGQ